MVLKERFCHKENKIPITIYQKVMAKVFAMYTCGVYFTIKSVCEQTDIPKTTCPRISDYGGQTFTKLCPLVCIEYIAKCEKD